MGWPLLKIVWQKRRSILFSTLMFMLVGCSPSYTDEEGKPLQSIPNQYVFCLLIVVMIML